MPSEIPAELRGRPFAVAVARDAGLSVGRLRASDLTSPFHGVRVGGDPPASIADLCRAYEPAQHPGHVFSHLTAAQLWCMPLPLYAYAGDSLHVTAAEPLHRPSGRGITGHRESLDSSDVTVLHGLRVMSPARSWCSISAHLEPHDLVAAAEWLITGNPFEQFAPPATVADIARAVAGRAGTRWHRRRMTALALMREGALSRPESLLRLVLVRAGIPAPTINVGVSDQRGSLLAVPDLAWPEYRVAVEYEGDHHRGRDQFRGDIHRVERLIDHGWLVTRVSADDLFDRPNETAARVARRLGDRGWAGRIDARRIASYRR